MNKILNKKIIFLMVLLGFFCYQSSIKSFDNFLRHSINNAATGASILSIIDSFKNGEAPLNARSGFTVFMNYIVGGFGAYNIFLLGKGLFEKDLEKRLDVISKETKEIEEVLEKKKIESELSNEEFYKIDENKTLADKFNELDKERKEIQEKIVKKNHAEYSSDVNMQAYNEFNAKNRKTAPSYFASLAMVLGVGTYLKIKKPNLMKEAVNTYTHNFYKINIVRKIAEQILVSSLMKK